MEFRLPKPFRRVFLRTATKPQDGETSLPVDETAKEKSLEATVGTPPAKAIDTALFHRLDDLFARGKTSEAVSIVAGFSDPNIHTDAGWNAMHIAASHGVHEAIKPLSKLGTSIEKLTDFGFSPLRQAVSGKHVSFASELLKLGADANIRDSIGRTPIFVTLDCRHLDKKQKGEMRQLRAMLLEYGADINIADDFNTRPINMAVEKATEDAIVWLLKNGADPNTEVDGASQLHWIARFRLVSAETVKVFVEYGASLEATDAKGLRPVDYAAQSGLTDFVEILNPAK